MYYSVCYSCEMNYYLSSPSVEAPYRRETHLAAISSFHSSMRAFASIT